MGYYLYRQDQQHNTTLKRHTITRKGFAISSTNNCDCALTVRLIALLVLAIYNVTIKNSLHNTAFNIIIVLSNTYVYLREGIDSLEIVVKNISTLLILNFIL